MLVIKYWCLGPFLLDYILETYKKKKKGGLGHFFFLMQYPTLQKIEVARKKEK